MAIVYEPYEPNDLKGQAWLDNFQRTRRTLHYRGNDDIKKRIVRGMPLYEVELSEPVNGGSSDNMLIHGECLTTCAYLKANNIKVDLVYIDPPFKSDADYSKKVIVRNKAFKKDELDRDELDKFEEKMYSDIWEKEQYLNWMFENLMAIRSIMSETASIFVHLDWSIGHYVKIMMDEIFGEDNFKNEIIWHYRTGNLTFSTFQRKHDTIFFYSKNKDSYFEQQSVKEYYVQIYGPDKKLSMKGPNDGCDEYGEFKISQMDDVWNISSVFTLSEEHKDYNTQKPRALLERIIKACSREGMLVADFFAGSGVTAEVANSLKRRFITCDINSNSIQTTRDSLYNNKASFLYMSINDGVRLYRNPAQTQDKLAEIIGIHKDNTLSKIWAGYIISPEYGKVPVYIPSLEQYERILDEGTMSNIAYHDVLYLPNDVKKVIVYYVDIDKPKEIEKIIKECKNPLVKIEIQDLKEILSEFVAEDDIQFTQPRLIEKDMYTKVWKVKIANFHSDRVHRKISEYNQKKQLQVLKSKKDMVYKPIILSESELETIEWVSLDCTASDGDVWHSDSEVKIENNCNVRINGTKTKKLWDGTISTIDERKPLRMKVRNICGDESTYILT